MTQNEPILVQILDDGREGCCFGCGSSEPAERQARMAAEYLERIYGKAVQVEFIDLAAEPLPSSGVGLAEQAGDGGFVFPVVAINGTLRLAGVLDYGRIADAIEMVREVNDG